MGKAKVETQRNAKKPPKPQTTKPQPSPRLVRWAKFETAKQYDWKNNPKDIWVSADKKRQQKFLNYFQKAPKTTLKKNERLAATFEKPETLVESGWSSDDSSPWQWVDDLDDDDLGTFFEELVSKDPAFQAPIHAFPRTENGAVEANEGLKPNETSNDTLKIQIPEIVGPTSESPGLELQQVYSDHPSKSFSFLPDPLMFRDVTLKPAKQSWATYQHSPPMQTNIPQTLGPSSSHPNVSQTTSTTDLFLYLTLRTAKHSRAQYVKAIRKRLASSTPQILDAVYSKLSATPSTYQKASGTTARLSRVIDLLYTLLENPLNKEPKCTTSSPSFCALDVSHTTETQANYLSSESANNSVVRHSKIPLTSEVGSTNRSKVTSPNLSPVDSPKNGSGTNSISSPYQKHSSRLCSPHIESENSSKVTQSDPSHREECAKRLLSVLCETLGESKTILILKSILHERPESSQSKSAKRSQAAYPEDRCSPYAKSAEPSKISGSQASCSPYHDAVDPSYETFSCFTCTSHVDLSDRSRVCHSMPGVSQSQCCSSRELGISDPATHTQSRSVSSATHSKFNGSTSPQTKLPKENFNSAERSKAAESITRESQRTTQAWSSFEMALMERLNSLANIESPLDEKMSEGLKDILQLLALAPEPKTQDEAKCWKAVALLLQLLEACLNRLRETERIQASVTKTSGIYLQSDTPSELEETNYLNGLRTLSGRAKQLVRRPKGRQRSTHIMVETHINDLEILDQQIVRQWISAPTVTTVQQ